jgi:hypothetical protein
MSEAKVTSAAHNVAETYVATLSCYAAIYDEASPANVEGFMEREFEAAEQQIDALGKDRWLTLFVFNERLIDRARRGELLAWTLVFDGVFRAVIEVGEPLGPESNLPRLIDNLGLPLAANLICPTGRLIVGCLSRLGQQQTPAVIVESGTYRVNFTCDYEEENKHMDLEALSDYPPGEGPDWRLALHRVQP